MNQSSTRVPDGLFGRAALLGHILHNFRRTWRQLAIAHAFYSVTAAVVLVPLATLLLRWFVHMAGSSALTDLDIVFFLFLRPVGIVGLISCTAVGLAIYAMELAVLMTIGFASTHEQKVGYREALPFACRRGLPILRLAIQVVGRCLLLATPFLAASGLAYWMLLTKYDINYYLTEKPVAFWLAFGLVGALGIVLVVLIVRLLAGWLFAMPLLLFEGMSPRGALRASWELTDGHRRSLVFWLVGWALVSTATVTAGQAIVAALGRLIVPRLTASLSLLALAIGGLVLLGTVANIMLTFLGRSALSLLVVRLYRSAGGGAQVIGDLLNAGESKSKSRTRTISGRTLVWASVAALLAAIVVGGLVVHGIQFDVHTQIVAHRGGAAVAPENTIAAFERAIAAGAHWIEIDVQETADGEVVVIHDSDLKKVAGVNLKIWDATLEQLRDIDIGSRFDPRFRDQRVPTLGQVLDLCKGKIGVIIELKYYGHQVRLEERVVEIVEAKGMASEIVVMSLDYDGVQKVRALRPHWRVGLLKSVSVGDVTKLDVDFIAVNARTASPAFIQAAHRKRKEVFVWTVNDPVSMSMMVSRGVDGIITDDPALGNSVLEQRAALSSPERLLLELAVIFGFKPRLDNQ